MTDIYVCYPTIIGSDSNNIWSAPSHYRNQCWHIVNWNFNEILIEIQTFSFKKIHFWQMCMNICTTRDAATWPAVTINIFTMWIQHIPPNTWRSDNVIIASKWRHVDVITSKWRHFDVITTSLLRNVSAKIEPVLEQTGRILQILALPNYVRPNYANMRQ